MKDVLLHGDCLEQLKNLPAESVQCIVTSPPYFGLRDYQADGQIGLEPTPEQYVAKLVEVFREARRVLRKDGVLWLNLGDSYSSDTKGSGGHNSKQDSNKGSCPATLRYANSIGSKQLLGMPWRVAFALQSDGWILRADCIWHKPNCMPESVKDRPTKAHEYLFLFAKSERYYYDADAIREPSVDDEATFYKKLIKKPHKQVQEYGIDSWARTKVGFQHATYNPAGRNKRTVWTIATAPYSGAHFATMPPTLVEPCILAGSKPGDVVLDPFFGAGTVGLVAKQHGRSYLGIELNASYITLAEQRIAEATKPRAKITRLPKRPQRAEQLALFA